MGSCYGDDELGVDANARGPIGASHNFGASGFYDSSQFVGIPPRLSDLHASDYSDVTAYGSNFNNTESYVSLPIGSMSWCLDSGATHHICQNASDLHTSNPYIGNSSLLMGNGDIQTQEILIRGQVRDGLYHFSVGSAILRPSAHNAAFQDCSTGDDVFTLWHKRLGHPSPTIVKTVLDKCQITCNKRYLDNRVMGFFIELPVLTPLNRMVLLSGYLFCSAVHLINRLPTSVLKGKSPYQTLFGHEPTYDYLRVFGCCCFPHLRPFVNHKLAFRLQPSTFLGYSSQHKGYYCLTPDGKSSLGTTTYVLVVRSFVPIESSRISEPAIGVSLASQNCATPQSVPCSSPQHVPVGSMNESGSGTLDVLPSTEVGVFKPKALTVDKVDSEPNSVEEALAHPDWCLAVQAEFDALIANSIWNLVLGYDFKETFSPVVKPATIQAILSIAQPPDYVQTGPNGERLVCCLIKALYGLRQAPRAWFNKLKEFLVSTGFVLSKSDTSLFVRSFFEFALYVLLYVDDIVITGSSSDAINCFVHLHLCQRKYIRELLDWSSMTNTKSVHTPMVSSSMLSKDEGEQLADPTEYCSLARALQYVVLTRPDIAYAVNRSDRLSLVGYADTNWGLDFDDRWSTTGYCVYFGHTPILWCSKKQQVVFWSTRNLAAGTSDIAWLVSLLAELNVSSIDLPTMWCDNSSIVAVATNLVLHSKFKHVELDLFFVRQKVASEDLVVGEVPACDQVADILNKPLSVSMFTRFCHLLRVLPLEEAG
ncbi:hypothetical protein CXB51_033059 [Gossypium anomalum]|uniref:Reverse transcriptase Ty1/copia-type domain-containing protein n=1 Tax=Gossypium anomalum TaxID=47600 RepID=A0A8J5Y329_9ROSI|nr:hypothetical protein CXB51_033059 [Gossypium anomalum]